MGPKIILDKSTFQSFSYEEIVVLHKYYFVVVSPILLLEILGDLSKSKQENEENVKKAMFLANKIHQFDSAINARHDQIILSSLLGNEIKMDRRPLVTNSKPVLTKDNKKGVIITETPEEKALHRWRKGEFTEAENILSNSWRNTTSNPDKLSDIKKQMLKQIPSESNVETLEVLFDKLSYVLELQSTQTEFLKGLIYSFPISMDYIQQIFLRWEQGDYNSLKEFAPFAYYCFKIEQFFYQGLAFDFFSTKATNEIDLMYLYYLPFSNIFSSNDKFHIKIIDFCLEEDQSFILGSNLKKDLQTILSDEKEEKNFNHAPQNKNTLTYKLWEKHLNWSPEKEKFVNDLEQKESENVVKRIKEMRKSKFDQNRKEFNDEETDFILRETWVGPEDLCPCRSGKKFGECCLPMLKEKQK